MLERNERIAMNLCYKKTQLPPKRQTTFKDYISFKLNGIENFTFNHESTMYWILILKAKKYGRLSFFLE